MSFTRLLQDGETNGESEHSSSHLSETERVVLLLQRLIQHVDEGTALETEARTILNRNSVSDILAFGSQTLKLEFVNQVPSLILTREKIICDDSAPLQIHLINGRTGQVVQSGPVAAARVEIVALTGDFDTTDWTVKEFESKIQTEMKGRKSILMNNVLNLKDGIGFLSNLYFTHNKIAVRNCELRLGAKVVCDFNGIWVKEAKTKLFTLKDLRSKRRQKYDSLSLHDDLRRVKGIGINGPFFKRLAKANINTVFDFLSQLNMDPQPLKQMHNGGDKMWAVIVGHASECKIDKKVYLYPSTISRQNKCVVFNVVRQVLGLLVQNQYVSVNDISETEKVDAQRLIISAFEHSQDIVPYADESELIKHVQQCDDNSSLDNLVYDPNISSPVWSPDRIQEVLDLLTETCDNLVYDPSISSPNWSSSNSVQHGLELLTQTCDNVKAPSKCNVRSFLSAVYFAVRLLRNNKRTAAFHADAHISKKVRCC